MALGLAVPWALLGAQASNRVAQGSRAQKEAHDGHWLPLKASGEEKSKSESEGRGAKGRKGKQKNPEQLVAGRQHGQAGRCELSGYHR